MNDFIYYKVGDKTAKVRSDKQQDFEGKYPDAKVLYTYDGRNAAVPIDKRDAFISKYGAENITYSAYDDNNEYSAELSTRKYQPSYAPAEDTDGGEKKDRLDGPKKFAASANDSLVRAQLGSEPMRAQDALEKESEAPTKDDEMADLVINSHNNNKAIVDDFLSRENKSGFNYNPMQVAGTTPMPAIGLGVNVYSNLKKVQRAKGQDYTDALIAQRIHQNIDDKVEQYRDPSKTFVGGVVEGIKDTAFDLETWDSGMSAEDAARVYAISKKLEKGSKLSEGEQMIIDALVDDLSSDIYLASEFGRGYKAGKVTGESLPFMVEMALNPASKLGEGIAKKFGTAVLKKVSNKVAASVAKGAIRVAGDIAGSAVMAATTGQARVAADALDRMSGHVDFDINEDGTLSFKGFTGGEDSAIKAYGKAFGATTIENFSEMVGNYFAPIGEVAKTGTAALAGKVGLKKIQSLLTEMTPNGFGAALNDFLDQTKLHGPFGEFAEEMIGGALNALVVGDQKVRKYDKDGKLNENYLFDKDNMIDTFLGVAILGGTGAALRTVGYTTPETRFNREIEKAKKRLNGKLTTEQIEQLEAFANNPLGADSANLEPFFSDEVDKDTQTLVGKYLAAVMQKEGYNITRGASLSGTQQGMAEMRNAYQVGENMSEADLYDMGESLNQAIQDVQNTGLGFTVEDVMSRSSYDLLAMSNDRSYTPEQREALKNLALVKNANEGLDNKLNKVAQTAIEMHQAIATEAAANDVVTVGTYKGAMVYVKGGVQVSNGSIVKPSNTGGHPVEIVDAVTGVAALVESKGITNVYNTSLEDANTSISNSINTTFQQRWDAWRNTKSAKSKLAEVKELVGQSVYIKTENGGMAEVEIQQILPNGEVLIHGKKGDLGGQSDIRVDVDSFYDSMERDSNGNVIYNQSKFRSQSNGIEAARENLYVQGNKSAFARNTQQQTAPANTQQPAQPTVPTSPEAPVVPEPEVSPEVPADTDFREQAVTILINGVPTEVEVTGQDNTADRITYEYIDENGKVRSGSSTIAGFVEAMNQAAQPTQETPVAPESVPTDELPPIPEEGVPVIPDVSSTPAPVEAPVETPVPTEAINWDALLDNEPEAYFAEMQSRFGEKAAKRIGAVIAVKQKEIDTLNKANPKTQEEIFENEDKKEALQNQIDVLNGMIARLTAAEQPVAETPSAPETAPETAPEAPATPAVPTEPVVETPAPETPSVPETEAPTTPVGEAPAVPEGETPTSPEATAHEAPTTPEPQPEPTPQPSAPTQPTTPSIPATKPAGGAIGRMIKTAKANVAKLAAKASIKDFTVDDNVRPVFGGVFRNGGYEHASDSHILAKIKAQYPAEQEGKIYSVKTGQEISGRFPNTDMVINSAKKVNVEIDTNVDDVLATAQAAEELKKGLDKNKKIYVKVGRCIFDSSYLLKAAKMAKQQGLTTITQHPTNDFAMLFTGKNGDVLIMPIKPGKSDVIDVTTGEATFGEFTSLFVKTPSTLKGIETARNTLEAIIPNSSEDDIENLKNSDTIKLVDGKVVYRFNNTDIINAKNKAKDPNTFAALENIEKNGLEIPLSESEIAKIFPEAVAQSVPTAEVGTTPVAPNPVANPATEAAKREKSLATQLKRYGITPEKKADMAFNAGKAVADMFATREEYDAYERSAEAVDLGDYLADFERGVEESFANRSKIESESPVNSVTLNPEPNGESNGEQQPTSNKPTNEGRGSDTIGGGTDNGGSKGKGKGGQKAKSPRTGKNQTSQAEQVEDKYPDRKGNATQKLLVETFGFESVTIPNTRKEILNTIYDFMMEMSKTLGISPNTIGQGGWLSVGNMNAKRRAAASHEIRHSTFTGDIKEVSLRFKYARLSSIAHEWWHSLDRALSYFETGRIAPTATEISERAFTGRKEALDAVRDVIKAINDSGYTDRITKLVSGQTRSVKEYYLENTEQAARAFDQYISDRFAAAGIVIENYDNHHDATQPIPEEMRVIAHAFDNLFKVLQEKEGKKPGTSVLYHIGLEVEDKMEEMQVSEEAIDLSNEVIDTSLEGYVDVERPSDEEAKEVFELGGLENEFSVGGNHPIFISNAALAVQQIKQEKATPEQWLKMIEKNGGLKAGEDKWMGLSEWLKESDEKTLTKQEVLDYITANTTQIEEVHYVEEIELEEEEQKQLDAMNEEFVSLRTKAEEAGEWRHDAAEIAYQQLVDKYGDDFTFGFGVDNGELYVSNLEAAASITGVEPRSEREINDTRLRYTTEGLDNKKEIALTVPTIDRWNQYDDIHFGDAGDGRVVVWVRFGEARTYAKEYADFYDFQGKMQKKYFPDRTIQALGGSDLDALSSEEIDEFERLREIARSVPAKNRTNRRVLVIDEIQSKRHQEGREKGYAPKTKVSLTELRQKAQDFEQEMIDKYHPKDLGLVPFASAMRGIWTEEESNTYSDMMSAIGGAAKKNMGVPDAPFDKNWHELAMKRMLRYAAENGYDAIAWTKGEQQAQRYSLTKYFNGIAREDNPSVAGKRFQLYGGNVETIVVNNEGVVTDSTIEETKNKPLSEVVGKEVAEKMMTIEDGDSLADEDIVVGGEGMKGFYDKMLPAYMNKYGKKWGVKVSDITLPHVEEAGRVMHSVPVTEAMKQSVMEGQPMFLKTPNGIVYGWTDGKKIYLTKEGMNPNTKIHEYTHIWAKAMMQKNPKGWNSIKQLLKKTPVWDEVMNDANYSNIHGNEDMVTSEVLSRISGTENAGKLAKMAQQMIDEAKGTMRKAEARGLIQNIKDALNQFWSWVGKNLFEIEKFNSIDEITDRVLWDLVNKTDLGPLEEGRVEASIIPDGDLKSKLQKEIEDGEYITLYRAVRKINGKYYSPKMSKLGGVGQEIVLGQLEQSDERPDLAYPVTMADGSVKYKVNLDGSDPAGTGLQKRTTNGVDYNPYIHASDSMMNDQFTAAFAMPEMTVIEIRVPKSELTSGYHAQYAAESVGKKPWKKGVVDAKLPKEEQRTVYLSRYDMPVREVSTEEIADHIAAKLLRNGISMPYNLVTPQVAEALIRRGVDVSEKPSGTVPAGQNEEFAKLKTRVLSELNNDVDSQGNPINADGSYKVESVESIDDITDEDFTTPRRNIVLPKISDNLDDAIGGKGKDVLIKKNIFEKNARSHRDLTPEKSREILKAALYSTNLYGQSQKSKKPNYWVAIKLDSPNAVVVIEVADTKEHLEIVGWRYANEKKLEELKEQAAREGGQFLILTRSNRAAADLSTLPSGLSDGKDSKKLAQDNILASDIQNAAVDYLAGNARIKAIENAVSEEAKKLNVNVTYKTPSEMPNGHKNDKGYYNTSTGEIVICTENASSVADAIQTILHEAVAHKGLRQLMGDKFNEFINRVYESLDADTKAKVDELAKQYDGNTAVAMEEYMASLAESEDFTKNSVWDKVKSIFEDIINAILGRNDIKIGDNELRYILRASYNNMVNPRGMDSVRGWVQDQMMREEYKINEAKTPELLSRSGIDPDVVAREGITAAYNKAVNSNWQEFERQFQDAYQPVRTAIEAIQMETGNIPIEDYENYLLIQNQSSSRSRVEIDNFVRKYYSPIIEQVNAIIDKIMDDRGDNKKNSILRTMVYKELRQYLIAKHGLERNKYYQSTKTRKLTAYEQKKEIDKAQKDYDDKVDAINNDTTISDLERQLQLRDALDEFNAEVQEIKTREVPDVRDYSGLTALFGMEPKKFKEAEAEAQKLVDEFEKNLGRIDDDATGDMISQSPIIEEFWKKINAATNKTLRHSYESGLLSRQQYNDIKSMFSFYIPLRGFDETTAEDVFAYARFEGNRFNPAVQTAEGRTSVADDPLAIIMNMAESEIAQGNKNRAKQALYSFILNRPVTDANGNQGQNSLMQIESVWYVKTVDSFGNEIYQIAMPNHASGETYEEFEDRMANDPNAVKSKKGHVDVGMRFQKTTNKGSHYVYLKVNGVEKAIFINGDPKTADAINGAGAHQFGEAAQIIRDVQRMISQTFTNYSLEFTARNYFRDMLYSHINIGIKESEPAYRKKFRQNWRHNNMGSMLKMLKAYRAGEYESRPLTEDEAAFVEFMENGGQTGYTLINSVEAHKKDLERAIKNMQQGIEKGGVKDSTIFKATLGGVELLNEASELVTRFAAFKTSRDMGRSIVKSISDAKEVTVNFNTRGAQDGKGALGFIAQYFGWSKYFFNASVQGVQNIVAMAKANKLKFCTTVGGIAAFGFMMPVLTSVIAELLSGDDDDDSIWNSDNNPYWNIPEYDRQNNFCIPVGGGKYVKIPLPIGFREIYAIGDMVAGMAFDKKFTRDAGQVGMDIANKISSIVLPINPLESSVNGLSLWQTALYTISPSSAQFLIQNATNVDWKGAPIQKEYTYNENDPQWMKAFAGNPDWMTTLSKWCNEHLNLDDDYKGMDWSPEKLDNTLSNLFGGVYTVVKKSGRTISMIWNEENRNLYNIPLAGVVVGSGIDSDDSFVTDAYYDEKGFYDANVGYIKRRAEKFGYTLDDIFVKEKGKHQPKIHEIYANDNFDFMQEWYKGNKELEKLKDKYKKFELKLNAKENPSQIELEELARKKKKFEDERRDFINDMLELD